MSVMIFFFTAHFFFTEQFIINLIHLHLFDLI